MHSEIDPRQLRDLGCIGLVLFACALALVPLVTLIVQRIFPGRNVHFARWGFSHVASVLALVLALLYLGAWLFPVPAGGNELLRGFGRMACAMAGGALLVAWHARRLAPEGLRALGFRAGGNLRALGAGLTAYLLLLPGLLGLALAWGWILRLVAPETGPQPLLELVQDLPRDQRWLAALLGVVVLPFFEELLFRGFLQPLLVQNLRDRSGVALTALLFALLHGPAAAVPVFGLALLLGAVMQRTQRLLATWSVHALHNGLVFCVLFVFPDLARSLEKAGLLLFP